MVDETPNSQPDSNGLSEVVGSIFGTLNREVWIVTSGNRDAGGGLLATWVSPTSIDNNHPVLVAGISTNHFTAELVDEHQHFVAHLLRRDQLDDAWNFCLGSGRDRDKLAAVATMLTASGTPRLSRCLAWMDCRVFARLNTGDRILYWADVIDGEHVAPAPPMCERDLIAAATPEQKQELARLRRADVQALGSAWFAWRTELPAGMRPGVGPSDE